MLKSLHVCICLTTLWYLSVCLVVLFIRIVVSVCLLGGLFLFVRIVVSDCLHDFFCLSACWYSYMSVYMFVSVCPHGGTFLSACGNLSVCMGVSAWPHGGLCLRICRLSDIFSHIYKLTSFCPFIYLSVYLSSQECYVSDSGYSHMLAYLSVYLSVFL